MSAAGVHRSGGGNVDKGDLCGGGGWVGGGVGSIFKNPR